MTALLFRVFSFALLVTYIICSEETSIASNLCNAENHYCTGPKILTNNNGRIISHPRFNKTQYGPDLSCVWVIIAPKGHVIKVRTTFLSIEYSLNCSKDFLSFYNGNGMHRNKRINNICGETELYKIKSSSNSLTIKFVTDSTVNKMGFQIRYYFDLESSQIDEGITQAHSSHCGILEGKCENSLECIARSWKCDGITDCQDGSDENNCVNKKCAPSTFKCANECIPNELFCGDLTLCSNSSIKFIIPNEVTLNATHTPRSGCSNQPIPNVQRKIVGGVVARKGSWPWQISIRHSSGIFCGGSIITGNWIVTAAHCVNDRLNPSDWRVYAGKFLQIQNENTEQSFDVQRVIMHEQYNPRDNTNDIALMMIRGNFNFNNYVQPVCLGNAVPPANTFCYITGWGRTQGTGGNGYLKQAELPIIDHSKCNDWYGGSIDANMLCAGYEEGGIDACQGDSGGPLVCKINSKYQLIGITSFGDGCALVRRPGVYTAAPMFRRWIIQAMQ